MGATIVHTRHGAELLGGGPRVHVIPHGAFEHLTRQPDERPLPPDLAAVEGPVVLCFGVVRPYKGVDVLVDAFGSVEGAELWVVGRPLGVSLEALAAPGSVRFVPRYVSDSELPAFFRRADLVVLPHRSVDVSGVLFAGLAFGKPMLLSDVGGFRELVEEHGAGRLVPPGDPAALAEAIGALLADPAELERLAARACAAAAGPYSWDAIAERTIGVYEEVLA
jgi:glycosyltransferase involved in cell wall biosynthesis